MSLDTVLLDREGGEPYVVAGVTVTRMKLEQSARRLLRGGLFPLPVTPRWQLLPGVHWLVARALRTLP